MSSGQSAEATETQPITGWLHAARDGDDVAMSRLYEAVYPVLHRMAAGKAGVSPDHTLTPTAVVNELFLRISDSAVMDSNDRQHFYATCSQAMRYIVMDFARMALSRKRGGEYAHHAFTDALAALPDRSQELLDLNAALDDLGLWDRRLCELVELKFFGGLTHAEIGALQERSERSIKRDWIKARAFLAARANDINISAS